MRKRLLLLFLAVGLVSVGGLVLVRIAKWNSLKRVTPTQGTASSVSPLPEPSVGRRPSGKDVLTHLPSPSQGFGGVSGRVIDAKGRPVANAGLDAWSSPARMGLVPAAHTNSRGVFKFSQLEVGKYSISVEKSHAGYASTENRFYAAGFVENPTVVVEKGKTIWCGDVRLGPKAGRLVGAIRDSETGNLIVSNSSAGQHPQLVFRRTEDPNNSYDPGIDINGNFEVLVPPISFTLEVVVAGYEKKNMGILEVKSGETKRLDIVLQRSASTSKNF
jgi:hypothetical protein